MIHFNVEGPRNKGMVSIHLIKRVGQREHEYKYFFLDVRGHQRIYLENADTTAQKGDEKSKTTLFGIKWR
jgi:mitochondrial import inner membrane translocase subunit TIM21